MHLLLLKRLKEYNIFKYLMLEKCFTVWKFHSLNTFRFPIILDTKGSTIVSSYCIKVEDSHSSKFICDCSQNWIKKQEKPIMIQIRIQRNMIC